MRRAGVRGAFWPTPTQEALLRIVIGPPEKSARLWRGLQPLDVRALDAGSFALLPLLYERLSLVASNDSNMSLLRGIYRSTWYRNQLMLERLTALLEPLREMLGEPVLIGGAAAATCWYPRIGSRPLPLLEFMITPGTGEAARQVAISCGWRPAGRTRLRRRFVDDGGRVLALHEGAPPQVAGPLGPERAFQAMRDAAQMERVLGETVRILDPTDQLMYLCGEGARTVLPPTVQWLLDLGQLLCSKERPSPTSVLVRARLFHLVPPVHDAFVYLSDVSEGLDLAEYVRVLVDEPLRRRDEVAYRLVGAEVRRLGGLPLVIGSHLRATADDGLSHSLLSFPGHLVDVWEADSIRQLPAAAMKKFRRTRRRRREGHHQ